jgi:hypothetical protein
MDLILQSVMHKEMATGTFKIIIFVSTRRHKHVCTMINKVSSL